MSKLVFVDLPLNQPMNEIFVVLAKDSKGNEGIVDINRLPLVFGEMNTLQAVIGHLPEIAKESGKQIRLYRFEKKEIIKEF